MREGFFANFSYGEDVQSVTIPFVPVGTNEVTAIHLGDASCRDEATYIVPEENITIPKLVYCESDDIEYELTGVETEQFGSIRLTLLSDGYAEQENAAIIYDVNGSVVYDYFLPSLNAYDVNVRNTGLLNLAYAPYTVVVGDISGNGLQANTCYGDPELEGGYLIEDGAGNVIYGSTTPPYGPLTPTNCNGNDAHSQAHTFTPEVEAVFGGNFVGTGVANGAINDGIATFNPATAGIGEHFIDYEFKSYYIRPNSFPYQNATEFMGEYCERTTINVYSEPQLELHTTVCNGNTTYAAVINVDLGEWNAITSGIVSSLEVTTTAGELLSDTTVGGSIVVNQIPSGIDITVTIGDESIMGCQPSITVSALNCLPAECASDSGGW